MMPWSTGPLTLLSPVSIYVESITEHELLMTESCVGLELGNTRLNLRLGPGVTAFFRELIRVCPPLGCLKKCFFH